MIDGHEGEGRVELRVDHGDVQPVDGVDGLPVGPGSTTQRIDSQLEARRTDGVHVNDVTKIIDVREDEVVLMRRCRPSWLCRRVRA